MSQGLPSPGTYQVAILSMNEVLRDGRLLKEARSLEARGVSAVRVCPRMDLSMPEWEVPEGEPPILRLQIFSDSKLKSAGAVSAPSTARPIEAASEPRPRWAGTIGGARQWLGRVRAARLMARRLKEQGFTVVVGCDLPGGMAAAAFAAEGRSAIYDAHELWVDMHTGASGIYRMLFGISERRVVRRSQGVMTVNPERAEVMRGRFPGADIRVVMNGPDERVYAPTPVHEPVRVIYQGGFLRNRGLEEFVEGFAQVADRAVLTLQGAGALESTLRQLVDSHGIASSVTFAGPFRPQEAVSLSTEHDIGFLCYKPLNLNNQLAAPNKLPEYLAAGVAVLANRLPSIESVVTPKGCGVLFDEISPAAIGDALEALVDDTMAIRRMKNAAWEAGSSYLWASGEREFVSLVVDALGSGDSA